MERYTVAGLADRCSVDGWSRCSAEARGKGKGYVGTHFGTGNGSEQHIVTHTVQLALCCSGAATTSHGCVTSSRVLKSIKCCFVNVEI